jgi:hypothetical protein
VPSQGEWYGQGMKHTERRVVGKLEGKSHYENLELDVRIILKWILKEEG